MKEEDEKHENRSEDNRRKHVGENQGKNSDNMISQ